MKSLAIVLCLTSCFEGGHPAVGKLKASFVYPQNPAGQLQTPGQVLALRWGSTSGSTALPLDAGAGTYATQAIQMGGNQGVAMSGAAVVCAPLKHAKNGAVTAQLSNDQYQWANSGVTASLIDGGAGDGGTPASLSVAATAFLWLRAQVTTTAAQVIDGGFFCDAGATHPNVIRNYNGTCYGSFIDSGTNFCDGGVPSNFCDAGRFNWTGAYVPDLACTAVTVPN